MASDGVTPQAQAAYERAKADQRFRPAQELIDSIERGDFQGTSGPIVNRLEWQEIKRRLVGHHE